MAYPGVEVARGPGRRRLLAGAATSLVMIQPAQAQAPAADTTAQSEIVVTATRRAEVLSKVPQSITAFNEAALDKRGVKDIAGIARVTPGLQLDPSGFGAQTNIAIRGISSTVGAATTGIYIDDTPIQSRQIGYSSTNTFPAVFDLERVEVLRGPQGTLFGAGSEGGTVRFITPQPSLDRFSVYARGEAAATQGSAASGEAGVAIGGPIVQDKLGFRVSGWIRRDGGYLDRTNLNPAAGATATDRNSNSVVTKVLRGALKWAPADSLEITPSIFYQDRNQRDNDGYWEEASKPSDHHLVNGQPLRQPDHDRFYLPALLVNYRLGDVQFISNTSYYHRDQSSTNDYSTLLPEIYTGMQYVPLNPGFTAYAANTNKQRVFTEEARLQSADASARLNWVLGIFYSRSTQRFTEDVVAPDFADIFGGVPPEFIFGQPLVDGRSALLGYGRGRDQQLAGFGEGTFALTDKLKLTAGVRFARTSFEGSSFFTGPFPGTVLQPNSKAKDHPVTPKFAINYQATPDALFYVTAAKGYRIGGANAPVTAAACDADLTADGFAGAPDLYKSDSLWSYEAGAKAKLLGGHLDVGASVFHVDWKNIQQSVYLTHCGAAFIANLGKARSDGFDAQATLRLGRHLTLEGTVGYTDAKLTDDISGGALNLTSRGDHLESHPWTTTVAATYDTPIADGYDGYFRGDYQYKSHGLTTTGTDNTTTAFDPSAVNLAAINFATLRAGVRHAGADVSLFVDNLTDAHPELVRTDEVVGVGVHHVVTYRPRTFGITGIYHY